jgi:hypothetical protein
MMTVAVCFLSAGTMYGARGAILGVKKSGKTAIEVRSILISTEAESEKDVRMEFASTQSLRQIKLRDSAAEVAQGFTAVYSIGSYTSARRQMLISIIAGTLGTVA